MSNRQRPAVPRLGTSDPRKLSSPGIVGGGPHEQGTAVIAASKAVLLDHVSVCRVDAHPVGGEQAYESFAMTLSGRVNKSRDRAAVTFLINEDGASAVVTELFAVASRSGIEERFAEAVRDRLADLDAEGNREHRPGPAGVDG